VHPYNSPDLYVRSPVKKAAARRKAASGRQDPCYELCALTDVLGDLRTKYLRSVCRLTAKSVSANNSDEILIENSTFE
jgi:hypothetical protein